MDPASVPSRADRAWSNGSWQSSDGLALHFLGYPGRGDRPTVIALRGPTCNARDAAPLADATARGMARGIPAREVVTVPRTGRAPTIAEPDSLAAIDRLLSQAA